MTADHFSRVQLKVLISGIALFCNGICRAGGETTDTPPRDPADGRVMPTTLPAKWKTPEERVEQIERAHALRNELLAKFPLPIVLCRRCADEAITVDGKLDEPAWQRAAIIEQLRGPRDGKPMKDAT